MNNEYFQNIKEFIKDKILIDYIKENIIDVCKLINKAMKTKISSEIN